VKAYLVYVVEPEMQALALTENRPAAENLLAQRKQREESRTELAKADDEGRLAVPIPRYVNARIVEVELAIEQIISRWDA